VYATGGFFSISGAKIHEMFLRVAGWREGAILLAIWVFLGWRNGAFDAFWCGFWCVFLR
jgi:hypothetical protein